MHGDIKPDNILVDSPSTSDDINEILKDAILVVVDLETVNQKDLPLIRHTPRYVDGDSLITKTVSI